MMPHLYKTIGCKELWFSGEPRVQKEVPVTVSCLRECRSAVLKMRARERTRARERIHIRRRREKRGPKGRQEGSRGRGVSLSGDGLG